MGKILDMTVKGNQGINRSGYQTDDSIDARLMLISETLAVIADELHEMNSRTK